MHLAIGRNPAPWALILLCGFSATAAQAEEARTHVVVFAPRKFQQLAEAVLLHHGGCELGRTWRESREAADVLVLDGAVTEEHAATRQHLFAALDKLAKNCGPEDTTVLVTSTYALRIGGDDYLCPVDARAADLLADPPTAGGTNGPASLIPLRLVIERLAVIPAGQRVLLLDAQSATLPLPDARLRGEVEAMVDRFASSGVRVPDNFWVLRGRGNRLSVRDGDSPMTFFMRSLVDGLNGHADGNADGQLTIQELSDYTWAYAERERAAHPSIHGKVNHNAVLALVNPARQLASDLAADVRDTLAEAALQQARNSLFAERAADAALMALSHAELYATSAAQREQILLLRGTAQTLQGKFAASWTEAQSRDAHIFALLGSDTAVYAKSKPGTRNEQRSVGLLGRRTQTVTVIDDPQQVTVKAGRIVCLTNVEGQRAKVEKLYAVQYADDAISFTELKIAPGWIDIADLKGQPPATSGSALAVSVRAHTPAAR